MRGNLASKEHVGGPEAGLSPRMRGNRINGGQPGEQRLGQIGSIPAHAGEPSLAVIMRPRRRTGSIPAHAGEPFIHEFAVRTVRSRGLSPRMRGNPSSSCPDRLPSPRGLSPRMRGNPAPSCLGRLCLSGSIPAHAGEPRGLAGRRGPAILAGKRGLSPRMRGNQGAGYRAGYSMVGSIPAHAGEPRCVTGGGARDAGLSPRMRGNLFKCSLYQLGAGRRAEGGLIAFYE